MPPVEERLERLQRRPQRSDVHPAASLGQLGQPRPHAQQHFLSAAPVAALGVQARHGQVEQSAVDRSARPRIVEDGALEMLVGLEVTAGAQGLDTLAGLRRSRLPATRLDGCLIDRARLAPQDFGQVGLQLPTRDDEVRPQTTGLGQRGLLHVRAERQQRDPAGGRGGLQHLDPARPGDALGRQVDQDQRRRIGGGGANQRRLIAFQRLGQRNRARGGLGHRDGQVEAIEDEAERRRAVFQARQEEQVVRQRQQPGHDGGRHTRGSSIVCCFWYLPFLSAYEMVHTSSASKKSTWAIPSLA